MAETNKLTIYGDYDIGKAYETDLSPDQKGEKKHIAEIVQKIRALRPFACESVTVNLKKADGTTDHPAFFRTARDRSYLPSPAQRYRYFVEIGGDGRTAGKNLLYRKEHLSCEEAVRLFEEICVARKEPDWRTWTIAPRSEETLAKKRAKGRNAERCTRLIVRLIDRELDDPLPDMVYAEALESLCQSDDFFLSSLYVSLCHHDNAYTGLKRLIEMRPNDPVLAAAKADLVYRGQYGTPDLKAAYDLYEHAARIGSLAAWFTTAKAFRDGWFGSPEIERSEKIVKSIYDHLVRNDAEFCIFAMPELLLELSRIEERHGNTEAAIEFCLKWKNMALENACNCCYPSEKDEQIVMQLYKLTEFDPSDTDLLDLFYVFKTPHRVTFFLEDGGRIEAESVRYEDEIIVKCGKGYYRTAADFFERFGFNGKRISAYAHKITYITAEATE